MLEALFVPAMKMIISSSDTLIRERSNVIAKNVQLGLREIICRTIV
jgi:hypothetical protein